MTLPVNNVHIYKIYLICLTNCVDGFKKLNEFFRSMCPMIVLYCGCTI